MIEIKHNTWPLPNMAQITEEDFWHHMTIRGCPKSNYIQGQSEGGCWFKPCTFVVNHGRLIGGGMVVKAWYSGVMRGKVEYFKWTECAHEFEEKTTANCYHVHTCKKCNARFDVDSSD